MRPRRLHRRHSLPSPSLYSSTRLPRKEDGPMPLRMLSRRPRHLHILVVSLLVLVLGIATGVGRVSRPTTPLETEAAAAVSTESDQFTDVPPSPVPPTPPAAAEVPVTTPPASADTPR